MEHVIIVLRDNEICFLSEKEEEILIYIKSIGFDVATFEKYMGMTLQEWIDNGHYVGDLTDLLPKGYYISTYSLGIDYRSDSPRFMQAIR